MTNGQSGEGGRRASHKSDAAFRTISEVAAELDVPQHVLRFWETKFSQIRPMKRGGGRRYYRPEDVVLLTTLRDLLYREGYTIKGVQKLLRENGAKALVTVVQERRERTDDGEAVGPLGFVIDGRDDEDEEDHGSDSDATVPAGEAKAATDPDPDSYSDSDVAAATGKAGSQADPGVTGSASRGALATAEPTHAGPAGLSGEQRAALDDVIADLNDLRRLLGDAVAGTTPPASPPRSAG